MRDLSSLVALMGLMAVVACSAAGSGGPPPTGVVPGGGGGHGTGGGGGGGGGGSNSVTVNNNFFSPSTITVPVGSTVTWTWAAGDVRHTVTDNADTTIMSPFQSAGTYSRTFHATGTFPYHCSVHGFVMSGSVAVQ